MATPNLVPTLDTKLLQIVSSAQKSVRDLLTKPSQAISDCTGCPVSGGVYVVYENGKVLYVGKAGNLRRRVFTDHLSGEIADTMSAFRRSLHDRDQTEYGPAMKAWIVKNCRYAFVEIPDADMRGVVESLAIAVCRTDTLLNRISHRMRRLSRNHSLQTTRQLSSPTPLRNQETVSDTFGTLDTEKTARSSGIQ
jgi:hypothetical protein